MEVPLYWLVVGGWLAWDFHRKYRAEELEAARAGVRNAQLEASLGHAKLQALSGQLRPHFLYNTLNAVAVLARQGRRRDVVGVVTRLSELLRASVELRDQLVPLQREIAFVRRYLGIERVRFRDRLTVAWSVAPECLAAELPSLLLQPLVENAIRHGIGQQPGRGRVELRARRVGDELHLSVRDNGPGLVGGAAAIREGIGLRTTRERLRQLYGDDHRLELTSVPEGGVLAAVTIPFRVHAGRAEGGEGGAAPDATRTRRSHAEDPYAAR
jgi:sensor histidine kinase YesM